MSQQWAAGSFRPLFCCAAALRSDSIDVDTHDVAHRAAAAAVARYDQTQRVIGKRCAIHLVRHLDGPVGELRGDLGQRDGGDISVRAGDMDHEVNLLGRLCRIDDT
jgi:hypothetical protein